MNFSEFKQDQVLEAGPASLSADEMIAFSRRYDPQWFHIDADRAGRSRWQGLIASGWHTCSVAMRLAVDAFLTDSESFGSPGLEYLKWLQPVRPGDVLTLRADVLETRRSQSQPHLGILKWRWRLFNQDENVVLDLVATSLFDLA